MSIAFLPALLAHIVGRRSQGGGRDPNRGPSPEPTIDPNTLTRGDWVDPRAVDWSKWKLGQ